MSYVFGRWDRRISRGLRSLVDWNHHREKPYEKLYVEAYVASWIEINIIRLAENVFPVEAYVASWIEIPWASTWYQYHAVEAYVASWIEIIFYGTVNRANLRRGLRSLVDWNTWDNDKTYLFIMSRLT